MGNVELGALQAICVAFSLWSITALSEKRRYGWLLKMAAQAAAIPLNLMAGLYVYMALSVVGVLMSLWGWQKWGRQGGQV